MFLPENEVSCLVVFDKSFQAASLGDASLIAIVATIQVLLHAVEELL